MVIIILQQLLLYCIINILVLFWETILIFHVCGIKHIPQNAKYIIWCTYYLKIINKHFHVVSMNMVKIKLNRKQTV